MAVVVVAFLAMYGSAQQVVRATSLQQEKTFASWVAFDQLTELRLADQLPEGERITGDSEMAGLEWRYVIELNDVGSEFYRQAVVSVSPSEQPERILAQSLAVLPIRAAGSLTAGDSGSALMHSDGSGATAPDPNPADPDEDTEDEDESDDDNGPLR